MPEKVETKWWWLKSKTFWGAILITVGGLMKFLGVDEATAIQVIGVGLTLIGLRHAIQKLKQ